MDDIRKEIEKRIEILSPGVDKIISISNPTVLKELAQDLKESINSNLDNDLSVSDGIERYLFHEISDALENLTGEII